MDQESYFIYLGPIIFAIPIIAIVFSTFIAAFSKIKHKAHNTSNALIVSYNIIGYTSIIFERIFFIPFNMVVLRVFECNTTETNIAGEVVSNGLRRCWDVRHIILIVYGIVSFIFYCGAITCSLLTLSMNYFDSPMPWPDDRILLQVIVLIYKIVLPILLIFDPRVTYYFIIGK